MRSSGQTKLAGDCSRQMEELLQRSTVDSLEEQGQGAVCLEVLGESEQTDLHGGFGFPKCLRKSLVGFMQRCDIIFMFVFFFFFNNHCDCNVGKKWLAKKNRNSI